MLQQRPLAEMFSQIQEVRPDLRMEVETNGTVRPSASMIRGVAQFVVSPKLRNAGAANVADARLVRSYAPLNAILKFVVREPADVVEAADFAREAGFSPDRVWLSPEGVDSGELAQRSRELVPSALNFGFMLGTRMHILLWGTERGR